MVTPEDHFVELVRLSPAGPAAPGEVVSAAVRVGRAKPGQRYLLRAAPSHPEVRLLGGAEAIVSGESTVEFRFTSTVNGRAGIEVAVEKVVDQDGRLQEGVGARP
jgi:hypothetical protein